MSELCDRRIILKFQTMSPVPILAITMASMIGISISGVCCLRSDCMPLTRRNIPDDSTMIHSNMAANHCVFPKPYVYRLLRDFSEILIVAWLTPDTNISRNESSADPRSARLHEKSPIVSLIAAIIPEIMSASRMPDEGEGLYMGVLSKFETVFQRFAWNCEYNSAISIYESCKEKLWKEIANLFHRKIHNSDNLFSKKIVFCIEFCDPNFLSKICFDFVGWFSRFWKISHLDNSSWSKLDHLKFTPSNLSHGRCIIHDTDKKDHCILRYHTRKYLLDERVQILLYPHQVPSCYRSYYRVFLQKMDDRLHRDG